MPENGDPPLVEPVIIPDVFVTGIDLETINGDIRFIGWVTHGDEHRIVSRMVAPDAVARALMRDLRKILAKGGN